MGAAGRRHSTQATSRRHSAEAAWHRHSARQAVTCAAASHTRTAHAASHTTGHRVLVTRAYHITMTPLGGSCLRVMHRSSSSSTRNRSIGIVRASWCWPNHTYISVSTIAAPRPNATGQPRLHQPETDRCVATVPMRDSPMTVRGMQHAGQHHRPARITRCMCLRCARRAISWVSPLGLCPGCARQIVPSVL